jgi:hypothetical protein
MVFADVNIGNSIQRFLNEVFAWIPEVLGAILILVVGYFVAKLIGNVVARALGRVGFDRALRAGPGGEYVQKVTGQPSRLLGMLAYWAVWVGAISLAVTTLGINALTDFVASVYAYLPHVVAAVLIFLVAGAVSAAVAALATRLMGDTSLGKIVATAAPILVMTVATFMILDELLIAQTIVTITYAGLVGAIALASALAFGLGGREVAGQMLQGAYEKGRESKEQLKDELQQGVDRAKQQRADNGQGSTADPAVTERTYQP